MKIGFTGTREGMSDRQSTALAKLLANFAATSQIVYLLHGGCHGSDEAARDAAIVLGVKTICYPGDVTQYVNNITINFECKQPIDYLTRNGIIVEQCDILIAAPLDMVPQRRGGTWYTIRKAQEYNKPCVILDR